MVWICTLVAWRLSELFPAVVLCAVVVHTHTDFSDEQWRRKRYGRYGGRHTNLKFGMANLLKFGQLIIRKKTLKLLPSDVTF